MNKLDWDTLCGLPIHRGLQEVLRPWASPDILFQISNRVRVGSTVFYAHLLLSLLGYHLRDTEFTPDKALEELSTLSKVYLRDSQKRFPISRTVPLTKTQDAIIQAVDRNLLHALA
jgi:hypothetical protein